MEIAVIVDYRDERFVTACRDFESAKAYLERVWQGHKLTYDESFKDIAEVKVIKESDGSVIKTYHILRHTLN